MDRNVMIERLAWLANAPRGTQADWLPDNDWQRGIAEVAKAALLAIPQWRPIDEAPIPDHEHVPEYWIFPCMIQDEAGGVYAGFARYANVNTRSRSPRVLRWYEGISQRYAQILKPRYYQPLPQPRKD